jgi:DNA-binding response OmpR family regulator
MSRTLTGCLILVVEDEPLVALDIADGFKAAGAEVIMARSLAVAMAQADLPRLTAAVIDHSLHNGTTTSDVCAKLKERNIPFVVYSGFSKLEGACAEGELVQKPASPQMLVTTLQGVLAQHLRGTN